MSGTSAGTIRARIHLVTQEEVDRHRGRVEWTNGLELMPGDLVVRMVYEDTTDTPASYPIPCPLCTVNNRYPVTLFWTGETAVCGKCSTAYTGIVPVPAASR